MKNLAIVAVMVFAMSASLFAQAKPGGIARQVSMGGSNFGTNLVLNPFIMEDPSLVLVNPAYQAMYKDYGWANVAGGAVKGLSQAGGDIGDDGYGHQNAGVAFGLNSEWNIGAILSYDPSVVNTVSGLIPAIAQRGTQAIPAVTNVWEAVISNHMNNLDWGLGVMYGWSNSDGTSNDGTTSTAREASSNVWGFRGGIVAPFGSGNSFDASAAVRLDKATDRRTSTAAAPGPAATGEYSVSGTELAFTARAKFNCSPKFNFVPYGALTTISAEPKEDTRPDGVTTAPGAFKASALAYSLGVGGEYRAQGFYFAGGMSYQSARVKTESTPAVGGGTSTATTTFTGVPVVNMGGEWWFLDWLAGRAGYYRWIGKINGKSEPATAAPATPNVEANASFNNSFVAIGAISPANFDGLLTLGLGLKFGGFSMDATVSEEALRRGLGVVGAQDNINSFGYVTTSYYFGE